ncbi:MauE/DoxX family redox-associated membrane protein [Sphingobacterium siyangense]|uniref:MauE/DoxX family redox-associated membrane protein n=1 Tax=Sphingobacterium siyangense TaxID=459529 RepID=UPI0019635F47|nr:MauE/DoxX family redox-associated membrane protein [Sphingobacterium siyangense]QRY55562.1 hypothetical protein JVX97_16100 [Sphingobacterium siyangense]
MKKSTIIEIISYAFVILFMYTAISKLYAFDISLSDLRRSPMLSPFANALAIGVPAVEIIISLLLLVPKTRFAGLVGALILMLAFTIYVSYLVFTQSELPCTCGGIIRQLTWKQHFFFNVFFTVVALVGVALDRKSLPDGNEKNYNLIK